MRMEESSPWISADLNQWSSLLEMRKPITLKKNAVLYHQEDIPHSVYVVKSGRICITSFQESGTEKQLYIAERGALFGEDSCMMALPYSTTAVAIVESQVYSIPFSRLTEVMQMDWDLSCSVMQMLCRKNLILLQQVVELSSADAFQRIAQVLMNLSRQYGVQEKDGICIDIRFTHQDVANLINASRVTVSNVLNALSGDGILEKRNGRFLVKEPGLLQEMAKGEH